MNTLLLIAVVLLQAGDIFTTIHIIGHGGHELNPVMVWLFSKFGTVATLVTKGLLISTMAVVSYVAFPLALLALVTLYAAVVGWNCYQIWGTK